MIRRNSLEDINTESLNSSDGSIGSASTDLSSVGGASTSSIFSDYLSAASDEDSRIGRNHSTPGEHVEEVSAPQSINKYDDSSRNFIGIISSSSSGSDETSQTTVRSSEAIGTTNVANVERMETADTVDSDRSEEDYDKKREYIDAVKKWVGKCRFRDYLIFGCGLILILVLCGIACSIVLPLLLPIFLCIMLLPCVTVAVVITALCK